MTFSVYTLFSGSSANAVLIRAGDDAILIDAGGSMKRVRTALSQIGCPMEQLRAIFVTHEHSDHIAAIPMLAKYHKIPVHVTAGSAGSLRDIDPALTIIHPPRYEVTVGPMSVRSFLTSHDSRTSVGYTVDAPGIRFGLATDTGIVTDEIESALMGTNLAIIEANHDPGMLRTGSYPADLKARIRGNRGHLSNDQSAELISKLARSGTGRILLAHLSAENNTPEIARRTVTQRLSDEGLTPWIGVAARQDVTALVENLLIPEGVDLPC